MKKLLFIVLLLFVMLVTFSADINQRFRMIYDFQVVPFFYESTIPAYINGFGGAWLSSSFEYNRTGIVNQHRAGVSIMLNATFRSPWRYIQVKIVNKLDVFFPNETGVADYSVDQVCPYYYGGIRVDFHPFFDWINLYLEVGGGNWIYYSPTKNINTGMFIFGAGVSVDITFPDTSDELYDLKVKYIQKRNEKLEGGIDTETATINIQKIKVAKKGDIISFNSIVFVSDSDIIKSESFTVLDEIAEVLNIRSDIFVEIGGYTNSVGEASAELELSVKRAMKVALYLAEKGVDPYRMKAAGYGGVKSINKGITEANRRVEIKILKTKIKF